MWFGLCAVVLFLNFFLRVYISKNFSIYFRKRIKMESPEFEEFGKAMIEYITNYLDNIRDR